MIKEIIVEFHEGDNAFRKRIVRAIQKEIYEITLEYTEWAEDEGLIQRGDLVEFPGKFTINIFDENEELMEIIET